jgi:RNA-directed DNA polymerase
MLTFLGHRIGDPRISRLIGRLLKGGILEDGLVQASEEGTPQGSILSPRLSNIYLHDGCGLDMMSCWGVSCNLL